MKQQKLIILYFIILLLELGGEFLFINTGIGYGIWFVKIFLMPVLALWYYKNTLAATTFDKIILASLFFSWWGDNFLMPEITSIKFLLGLSSFFLAHVFYILAFLKTPIKKKAILSRKPWLVFPFIIFMFALISFLFNQQHPDFAEMSIPVVAYAAVIMIMVLAALNRFERVNHASYKWVFIGAILFMASDSIIALQNFSYLFEDSKTFARFLIMPLYVIGQYLIIKGCVLQHKQEVAA